MAVRNKYSRFGLRADKNLSDLPDSQVALGNVLDDLVTGTPFSGFDLKVIDGLRNTNTTKSDLAELAGQESKYTPITQQLGETVIGDPEVTTPVLTIQNVIDNRKTILGDPPIFRGGDGPRATVFPGTAVSANSHIGVRPIFDDTNDFNVVSKDYWLDGYFGFSDGIHPTFEDNFGGIQWEGYLGVAQDETIGLRTNGYFLIEKEDGLKRFVPILSNTASNRTITLQENVTANLEFNVSVTSNTAFVDGVDEYKNRWIGNCVFVNDIFVANGTTYEVTSVEYDLDAERATSQPTIGITKIDGPENGVTGIIGDEFTLRNKVIGSEVQEFVIPGDLLFDGELRAYKMSLWWPKPKDIDPTDNRLNYPSKWATFDFADNTSSNPAPYVYWYENHPNLDGTLFSYQYFINNKISNRNERTETFVESSKQIFTQYNAPIFWKDAWLSMDLRWLGRNKFEILNKETGTATSEIDIQAGDRLVISGSVGGQISFVHFTVYQVNGDIIWTNPVGESTPDQIWDSLSFVCNSPDGPMPVLNGTCFAFVLKADGLQGIYMANTAVVAAGREETFQLINPSDAPNCYNFPGTTRYSLNNIKGDNIIHYPYNPPQVSFNDTYIANRIVSSFANTLNDSTESADVVVHPVDPAFGNSVGLTSANRPVAVYSHRGLDDASVTLQCVGVFGKEVKNFPEAPAGTNRIAVDSIEGIDVGDYVEYKGIIPTPTTVTNIIQTPVTINGEQYHEIELSNNLFANLPNAFTILFIKNSEINRYSSQGGLVIQDVSFCVLPFNTAPPFLGTPQGLSTSLEYPHVDTAGGRFIMEQFELEANTFPIFDPETANYNRGVRIQDGQGNTFFMIGSTIPENP